MKISLNWLKDFVDVKISPEELAAQLSAKLTEVESVTDQSEKYKGIVCVRINELKKHPNSDHLWLVKVFDGSNNVKIVCGAQNLAVGQIVPLIMPGTNVPSTGDILNEATIRGEKSAGMLCSGRELGLSDDHDGIYQLDPKIKPGTSLSTALSLNDVILEIENKALTHRGDCFSHLGIAREVAAITNQKLKEPKLALPTTRKSDVSLIINIENNKDCPRYMAAYIQNVKIGPSPKYIQERLQNCGIRPINNLVDFTNYVMLDAGQPLHAFDARKLKKEDHTFKMGVRKARNGESITTLDETTHKLSSDNIVITNSDEAVAVAGVMGGASSEISGNTTEVVIEAANFDHYTVRRSSRTLGLRTEASMRYEKNMDPSLAELGMSRILQLITENKAGDVAAITDNYPDPVKPKVIKISEVFIKSRLGIGLSLKEANAILNRLGLLPEIPTFRRDLNIPEDLIEEIARIYGYDKITPKLPSRDLTPVMHTPSQELERQLLTLIKGLGYSEVYSYSFVGKGQDQLEIVNPLSPELKYIRSDLKPGLLEKVTLNSHNFDHFKLFELGKEIHSTSDKTLPNEVKKLVAAYYDRTSTDQELLFRKAKGDLEIILNKFNLIEKDKVWNIKLENKNTVLFELDLKTLFDLSGPRHQVVFDVSKFPPIIEDISFFVNPETKLGEVVKEVAATSKLISNVELFDVYRDSAKKSAAIKITYQDVSKPLSDKEVLPIRQNIIAKLEKKYKVTVRRQ